VDCLERIPRGWRKCSILIEVRVLKDVDVLWSLLLPGAALRCLLQQAPTPPPFSPSGAMDQPSPAPFEAVEHHVVAAKTPAVQPVCVDPNEKPPDGIVDDTLQKLIAGTRVVVDWWVVTRLVLRQPFCSSCGEGPIWNLPIGVQISDWDRRSRRKLVAWCRALEPCMDPSGVVTRSQQSSGLSLYFLCRRMHFKCLVRGFYVSGYVSRLLLCRLLLKCRQLNACLRPLPDRHGWGVLPAHRMLHGRYARRP
jgi:hypothetical protein